MSEHYWLYVSDPKRNFSRDRKLPFEKVIAMLVSMGGGSLRNELIDYSHCSANMASAPAFVQRRAQLLPEALEYLFHRFTEATAKERLCKGSSRRFSPDAETNISRNLVPVRPNRKALRNLNRPRSNGFLYKIV